VEKLTSYRVRIDRVPVEFSDCWNFDTDPTENGVSIGIFLGGHVDSSTQGTYGFCVLVQENLFFCPQQSNEKKKNEAKHHDCWLMNNV